jgi:hypothetical protein
MVDDNFQLVWFLGLLQELGHSTNSQHDADRSFPEYEVPDYSDIGHKVDCWRGTRKTVDENIGVSGAVSRIVVQM